MPSARDFELKKRFQNKKSLVFLKIFTILILFQKKVDDLSNDEVEVDIDELLDLESEELRRRHLQVMINSHYFDMIMKNRYFMIEMK